MKVGGQTRFFDASRSCEQLFSWSVMEQKTLIKVFFFLSFSILFQKTFEFSL